MVRIEYTHKFKSSLLNLILNYPELEETINQRVDWFKSNPNDTRLRNHSLIRRFNDKWSFSISDEIRIIYEWLGVNAVRFINIGTHEEVY